MIYKVFGPYSIPRDGVLIAKTPADRREFWSAVQAEEDGLPDACGCYVFSIRRRAWYVGLAERQTFCQECFSIHKLNQYNYSHGLDKSGIHYDADLKLGASGVLADFYPLRGRFRLTGGALSNRNKFDLKATPTSDVTIGNNTYTPAQVGTLRGDIRFRSAVPYFGIGFGNAAKGPHRVGFAFDLGLMPQGRPRVGLTSSTGVVSSSDLQKEESKVSDDSKNFKFWPVLAVGLSFRI